MRLAQVDDEYLLLGRYEGLEVRHQSGGVGLWVSDDGYFWSDVGEVIGPEYNVRWISNLDDGLAALAEGGVVLLSEDGREWSAHQLPRPDELADDFAVEPYLMGQGGERQVVFGRALNDETTTLEPYLPEEVNAALEAGYPWDFTGNERLRISGPWGITIYSIDLTDVDVPVDVRSRFSSEARLRYVWVRDGEGPWTVSQLDADWVETVSVAEDGTITAFGSRFGPQRFTSGDGLAWEANDVPTRIARISPWRDDFVGVAIDSVDIALSDDGTTWSRQGFDELLPGRVGWTIVPISVSDQGIAAFVARLIPGTQNRVATVEKDGYTLRADSSQGRLELHRRGDGNANPIYSIGMHAHDPPPVVVADLESKTYTFLENGEPLVTFTFAELQAAAASIGGFSPFDLQGLFFSGNGDDWTIQDMDETLNGEFVADALVAEDRVILVTIPFDSWRYSVPQPRIHVGLIPAP